MGIKAFWMLAVMVMTALGCASDGGDGSGPNLAVSAEPLTSSQLDPNQPPLQIDPGGVVIGVGGTGGTRPPLELKPCTDTDRQNCQQCQDNCEAGICSTDQGDDRAGSCIGLFCPTRCDTCILSCSQVRSCVRCFGR